MSDVAVNHQQLLATAVEAARAGGEVLLRWFRSGALDVQVKAENDFVTRADRESENVVRAIIARRHPDHAVLGEEGGASPGAGEFLWVVDPLDGTTNFLQGLPVFCVSIACMRGQRIEAAAVLDPLGDNLFTATRGGGARWNGNPIQVSRRAGLQGAFLATGYPFRARGALDLYLAVFREVFLRARAVRRCGAAALDLAYTAAGVYDGFFEFRLSPWDVAAGALLVREAGGAICDLDGGERYLETGNVLAAAPGVLGELRAAVAVHADEAAVARAVPSGPAALPGAAGTGRRW
ncbi:MAG: inositol monophosphatase family protein [Acidobacteriota bacterium]